MKDLVNLVRVSRFVLRNFGSYRNRCIVEWGRVEKPVSFVNA